MSNLLLGLGIPSIIMSGGGLAPPLGFAFLTDDAGTHITDDAGTFIIVEIN